MLNGWYPVLLFAITLAGAGRAQEITYSGILLDAGGGLVPEGTVITVGIELYRVGPGSIAVGMQPSPRESVVGPGGRFVFEDASWPPSAHGRWLHVRRTGEGEETHRAFLRIGNDADGSLGAVFAWNVAQSSAVRRVDRERREDLGQVTLQPETRLVQGSLVDERGTPCGPHGWTLGVDHQRPIHGPPAHVMIQPRWMRKPGGYELHGWRAPGSFVIVASRGKILPSRRFPFEFGAGSRSLTVPTTGVLEARLSVREPVPSLFVEAVLLDLDRGSVHRRELVGTSTGLIVPPGRYSVAYQFQGVQVANLGELAVKPDEVTKTAVVDLSEVVHVIHVEVVDEEGLWIPAARIRVGGASQSFGQCFVRQPASSRHAIPVLFPSASADLEIFDLDGRYETRRLEQVSADQRIVLETVR